MRGSTILRVSLVVLGLVALSAGAARADFAYNFDDGTNPFTTYAGTPVVSTDHAVSDGKSLYVAPGTNVLLDIPGVAAGGLVTMEVFDLGKWCDDADTYQNGWRAGLTGASQTGSAHFSLMRRAYMSTDGYAYSQGNDGGGTFTGWYSPWWAGLVNRPAAGILSATPNDGSAGTGMWIKFGFQFDTVGNVSMFRYDANDQPVASSLTAVITNGNTSTGEPVKSIFIYGGDSILGGLYVDDVTFTAAPEPATLSLLGIGVLALIRRRNRK